MLFVALGVNLTPMDGGAEDELPQPAKPKVRRAINPDSKTATVTRFTVPPDTREFRILPISSLGASSFTKGVTTSYSSTRWCPILELSPFCGPSLLLVHGHFARPSGESSHAGLWHALRSQAAEKEDRTCQVQAG